MRALVLTAAIALVVAADLLRLGSGAAFVPALPPSANELFEARGLVLQMGDADGVRVHAQLARPGHERLGPFWLGFATFLALDTVEATQGLPAGTRTLRCRHARLERGGIRLEGPVLCTVNDHSELLREARISTSGAVVLQR
jgi:hypothetical protein